MKFNQSIKPTCQELADVARFLESVNISVTLHENGRFTVVFHLESGDYVPVHHDCYGQDHWVAELIGLDNGRSVAVIIKTSIVSAEFRSSTNSISLACGDFDAETGSLRLADEETIWVSLDRSKIDFTNYYDHVDSTHQEPESVVLV